MKIKNDFIVVKTGKKQYELRNTILNTYLKKFIKAQTSKYSEMATDRILSVCLLKFDTPLVFDEESEIRNEEFDIAILQYDNLLEDLNKSKVSIQYLYKLKKNDTYYDYSESELQDNLEDFFGRKITAIGFNNTWSAGTSEYVCAILDTNNYNIYLQENQDLSILRRDVIHSDGDFFSDDFIGAIHLTPCYSRANLHSIALSYYKDFYMNINEYEIGEGEALRWEIKDTEIIIRGLRNYLVQDSPFLCSEKILCGENRITKRANYRYVILKYEGYEVSEEYGQDVYTVAGTYLIAVPVTKFGKIILKIKLERG